MVRICTAAPYKIEVPGAGNNNNNAMGGILIFLTGVAEVGKLCRKLQDNKTLKDPARFRILVCFSDALCVSLTVVVERKGAPSSLRCGRGQLVRE